MKRTDVGSEAIVLPAVIAALVGYVASHALSAPLFQYLPIERVFVWRAPAGAVSMSLYGYISWALLAAALAALAAAPAPVNRALMRRLGLLRGTFAVCLALAFTYIAVVETAKWIL